MISVVIPTYNACGRLALTLAATQAFLDTLDDDYELVPVSDGSDDGTPALLRAVAGERVRPVFLPVNRGKGYAVREGCLAARGDFVIYMDDDLAVPPEFIARALALLEGADVVVGSRAAPGAVIARPQPPARRALGRLFAAAVRLGTGLSYRDTQCGFKGFRREAARAVFGRLTAAGFAFDVEVLLIARALGLKVAEMGVVWSDGANSTVSWSKGAAAFLELARLAVRARLGGFVVERGQAGHAGPALAEVPPACRDGL